MELFRIMRQESERELRAMHDALYQDYMKAWVMEGHIAMILCVAAFFFGVALSMRASVVWLPRCKQQNTGGKAGG